MQLSGFESEFTTLEVRNERARRAMVGISNTSGLHPEQHLALGKLIDAVSQLLEEGEQKPDMVEDNWP